MLSDVAVVSHRSIVFPGGGVFVLAVIVVIVLILVFRTGRGR